MENKYDGYQVITIPARIHILDIKVLKELQERYKDRLTEEQNKELEELIRMEENKYYTPEISEFYIGFEFEHLNYSGKLMANHPNNKVEWNKEVCDWDWLNIICDDYEHDLEEVKRYRVKYLSKEDIESLGFIYQKHNTYYKKVDNLFIRIEQSEVNHKLSIIIKLGSSTIFEGILLLKNKSEFSKFLSQVNING